MFLLSLLREKLAVTRWARRTARHVGRSSGVADAYRPSVATPGKRQSLLLNPSVSPKLVWAEFNVNRQTYPGERTIGCVLVRNRRRTKTRAVACKSAVVRRLRFPGSKVKDNHEKRGLPNDRLRPCLK